MSTRREPRVVAWGILAVVVLSIAGLWIALQTAPPPSVKRVILHLAAPGCEVYIGDELSRTDGAVAEFTGEEAYALEISELSGGAVAEAWSRRAGVEVQLREHSSFSVGTNTFRGACYEATALRPDGTAESVVLMAVELPGPELRRFAVPVRVRRGPAAVATIVESGVGGSGGFPDLWQRVILRRPEASARIFLTLDAVNDPKRLEELGATSWWQPESLHDARK